LNFDSFLLQERKKERKMEEHEERLKKKECRKRMNKHVFPSFRNIQTKLSIKHLVNNQHSIPVCFARHFQKI